MYYSCTNDSAQLRGSTKPNPGTPTRHHTVSDHCRRLVTAWDTDGTLSPGHGSPRQRFWSGRVGTRVSVSDPVFDPVLSFNMRVYRGIVYTQ